MNYIDNVKPISYLKSNTADIVKQLNACREPMLITQNGVVQLVVQDVYSFQKQEQTIAMLSLLAQGQQQIAEGKVTDADDVFARLDSKL
jgi:PHD/YefM family antitoxin component YafN of YafNO toxin-antitoxin module